MEGELPNVMFLIGKMDIVVKYSDQRYKITVNDEQQYYTSDLATVLDLIMTLADGSRICAAYLWISEDEKIILDLSKKKNPEKDIKRMLRMCSNLYVIS